MHCPPRTYCVADGAAGAVPQALAGKAKAPRRHPGRRGFTLIELSVTVAIIALIIGLVTVSITNIRKADLTKSSGVLSAAMRYLYNLAVINRTPYRLVIDLDEGNF